MKPHFIDKLVTLLRPYLEVVILMGENYGITFFYTLSTELQFIWIA